MAAFHFENELRMALREAALQETQRGQLAGWLATGRSGLVVARRSLVTATALLVTMIAVAALAVLLTFGHPQREPVHPPKVVARLSLGDSLGGAVAAYGSLWVDDKGGDRLLRVDPRTHRVTARIPVPGDVAMAPAGGSIWTLLTLPANAGTFPTGSLMQVNGQTGRVLARTPLRTPSGDPFWGFTVAAGDAGVWVLGTTPAWHDSDRLGVLRVDPRTGRVTTLVPLPKGWGADGIAVRDGALWAITVDPRSRQLGRLLRFDARTGAKLFDRRISLPPAVLEGDPTPGTFGFAGDTLVETIRGGLAGIDPSTGRVIWRRAVGQGVQAWTGAHDLVWVTVRSGAADRLVAVDPRDGRVATSAALGVFGTAGIAPSGKDLWVTTGAGTALILRR